MDLARAFSALFSAYFHGIVELSGLLGPLLASGARSILLESAACAAAPVADSTFSGALFSRLRAAAPRGTRAALLSCDGDVVLWGGDGGEEGGDGGGAPAGGTDPVAPLCSRHAGAGFATHAGLFDALHAAPAVLRAACEVRRTLLACADGEPAALLLVVEDADLLQGGEEGGEEAGADGGGSEPSDGGGGSDEGEGPGAPSAPIAALRALCGWALCTECWAGAAAAAACGGAASGEPPPPPPPPLPALLLLTATHGPSVSSSGAWALPHAPPLPVPAALLLAALRPAAGRGAAGAALSALPLFAEGDAGGGAGCDGPFPVALYLRAPPEGALEAAAGAPPLRGGVEEEEEEEAPWGAFLGFPALKQQLLRQVVLPLLASALPASGGGDDGSGGGGSGSSAAVERALAAAAAAAATAAAATTSAAARSPAPTPSPLACLSVLRSLRAAALRPPSGALLLGPPGSGKSALAAALARAARLSLLSVSCPALLSPYLGDSEAAIRSVFSAARAAAPTALLLDDIDAIAGARGGVCGSGGAGVLDRLVATLLTEMEGVEAVGGVVFFIATCCTAREVVVSGGTADARGASDGTLAPAVGAGLPKLDAALLRPGRLELHVRLPSPDEDDRAQIIAPGAAVAGAWAAARVRTFAAATEGWSAAEAAALMREAALCAAASGDAAAAAEEEEAAAAAAAAATAGEASGARAYAPSAPAARNDVTAEHVVAAARLITGRALLLAE
jgi:hypothetical protein